jgi:hypothetical protein
LWNVCLVFRRDEYVAQVEFYKDHFKVYQTNETNSVKQIVSVSYELLPFEGRGVVIRPFCYAVETTTLIVPLNFDFETVFRKLVAEIGPAELDMFDQQKKVMFWQDSVKSLIPEMSAKDIEFSPDSDIPKSAPGRPRISSKALASQRSKYVSLDIGPNSIDADASA